MTDVTLIGGGIIGLMTAREFALNGARVRLLERGIIGGECSWAGGGILTPLYPWCQPESITTLCAWSQAIFSTLAERLKLETGIDPEWKASGMIVADNPDLKAVEEWCRVHTVAIRNLDEGDFGTLAANLRLSADNPIYLPGVAQIRSPRLIRALRVWLEKTGVELLEGCAVTKLVAENHKIRYVKSDLGAFHSDYFILAAGAWTQQICPALVSPLRMEPVKGQMILFKAEPDLLSPMVLDHGRYLIPRNDGRILVGSTVERSGFDKGTTSAARHELEEFAYSRMPCLRDLEIQHQWAGLRPASPSGIPVICKHPEIDNLSMNCGHFRNGLLMAPASARLLLDLVLGRNPIVEATPYRMV